MRPIQAATLFVAALSGPGGAPLTESGQGPVLAVVREGGPGEIHHYTAELEAGAFVEIPALRRIRPGSPCP